jgi:hypothetical protein
VDTLRAASPPDSTGLDELPLPPLGDAADAAVRRARAFLFGVALGGFWTRAVLLGYTPDIHAAGVAHFRAATAEYSFAEWRSWRTLRPAADPDLPDLVGKLAAFRDRWLPRALEAVSVLADEGDREEVTFYIGEEDVRPSRTWTAKAFVQRMRAMENMDFYRPVWAALVAAGFLEELSAFDRALAGVQDFLRSAPLEEAEIAEIHAARTDAARRLEAWLDERRKELAPSLDERELVLLGLGDLVPPPFEGRSAFLLREIEIAAKT